MLIFISCVLLYVVIAGVTAGYVHALKADEYHWEQMDSGFVGAGWPISFFWYVFLKPIVKLSMRFAEWQIAWVRGRKEAVEKERNEHRIRIAAAEKEIEKFIAREEEDDSSEIKPSRRYHAFISSS
jgi:hypothetical protein